MSISDAMVQEFLQESATTRKYLRLQNVPLPSIYGPSADER